MCSSAASRDAMGAYRCSPGSPRSREASILQSPSSCRANERTALWWRCTHSHSGAIARLATMDAFRMLEAHPAAEAPFRHREKHAFHVLSNSGRSVLPVMTSGSELRAAGIGNTISSCPSRRLIWENSTIEIAEVRHVSSLRRDISSDSVPRANYGSRRPHEDVGAFVHELLRRRQAIPLLHRSRVRFSIELPMSGSLERNAGLLGRGHCPPAPAP